MCNIIGPYIPSHRILFDTEFSFQTDKYAVKDIEKKSATNLSSTLVSNTVSAHVCNAYKKKCRSPI